MRPLKTFVWKLWCTWNGHVPTLGSYRNYNGKQVACVVCKHCHTVLQ